ncbi:MAG TPA: saccharopine dehydrogenase C-terminal domain-containing protein [Candidatus Kapabacteria bacterium]|nr:saccharopine dehydrogenase C-terminal domain-containing protein [Candidatus Kapabacteria bacterium]
MKILILGSGLMGPAAAYNAINDPDVTSVCICDRDRGRLDAALARLAQYDGAARLHGVQLDLAEHASAVKLFAGFDVIMAALPWGASMLAFAAALEAHVPIVDFAIPGDDDLPVLRQQAEAAGCLIFLGCGLEPGLTEIVARRLAGDLDSVSELHIKCGGVPAVPTGPLGYKIVFGGTQLPLRNTTALDVEQGVAQHVARYSGVEMLELAGVGECEAWHEGMMPWLLEMDEFRDITEGTQKTIRWPGYAAKATVLLDLGLLGTAPIDVGGVPVIPKQVVDSVLAPHVTLHDGEEDITLFRVEVVGMRDGRRIMHRVDMVDRYDRVHGFTSMARTTAFTGAIAARMVGRGDIRATGLHTSEALITGPLYDRMMAELEAEGIHFEHSVHEL